MMTESELTAVLCRQLEIGYGADCYAVVGTSMSRSGYPDRILTHRDVMCWLEFKSKNGVLSALQRQIILRLNKKRANSAYVVRHSGKCCGTIEDANGRVLWTYTDARSFLEYFRTLS